MMRLRLASASPRRLALLEQIGVRPDEVCPAELDETPNPYEKPGECALRLAIAKATTGNVPEALCLGADTIVAVGRRILGKCETRNSARACLELLSGRAHRVFTGVALAREGGPCLHRLVETRVRFKRLSRNELEGYLDSGEWQGKAGGYAIQGFAARFVTHLAGSYSAVVGLPLFETACLLEGAGWRRSDDAGPGA
jgi:septum formation protein